MNVYCSYPFPACQIACCVRCKLLSMHSRGPRAPLRAYQHWCCLLPVNPVLPLSWRHSSCSAPRRPSGPAASQTAGWQGTHIGLAAQRSHMRRDFQWTLSKLLAIGNHQHTNDIYIWMQMSDLQRFQPCRPSLANYPTPTPMGKWGKHARHIILQCYE